MVEITEKEVELNNMLDKKISNYMSFLDIGIHNRRIIIDSSRIDTSRSRPPYYPHSNLIRLSVLVGYEPFDWCDYDFIYK